MSSNWEVGSVIRGRWEIHRILQGGMGYVYVVFDREWSEPLAVKTFQDQVFARNPHAADRFVNEAHTWINLDQHENIVVARFVQQIDGKPYIFLEYVSGGDLSSWIHSQRLQNDVPLVLRLAIQFCDGMVHANSKGIQVHRDVKPQNCLVTESGVLKVTDFGLAKVIEDSRAIESSYVAPSTPAIGLTQAGTSFGTCTHMAPEQFDDAKNVDVRADIYSFGIMLFEMLTGSLPFKGRNWSEYEYLHKRQPLPRLSSIDSQLTQILEKCTAKIASERVEDFARVRGELCDVFERLTGHTVAKAKAGQELDAYSLVNKGVSLKQLGRLSEAIFCYDRALSLNPSMPVAWMNKGSLLDAMERHREALDCYDRSLQVDPNLQQAWYNKGIALSAVGENEEAISCFEKAHTLNPKDEKAWCCKAIALSKGGRVQEAIESSERCLQVNPEDASAWYNMGALWGLLKNYKEAVSCYDQATKLNANYAQAWFNMAQAMGILGQYDSSIEACNHAISLKPDDPDAWFIKGAGLETLHRHQEAIECFTKAAQLGHGQAKRAILDCQREWEIANVCREAESLAAKGGGITGLAPYLLLNKWAAKYERSASLWFTMAVVLRQADPQYRPEALTAAQNAMLCYRENPKQLTTENYRTLQQLLADLSESASS